jgi:hypothetical protein
MIQKIIVFLMVFLFFTCNIAGFSIANKINKNVEDVSTDSADIDINFEVRKPGSSWEDSSLTADVDSMLEFRINVQAHRSYEGVGIYVELPSISGVNMFEYVTDSSSPKPVLPFGVWDADDTNVMWFWFLTGSSWSKEASFKAYIREEGTRTVNVRVTGVISFDPDDPLFDESTDSVEVTGEDDGPCCFPAGTLITMADGSHKKIEDIYAGDWVLGFNIEKNRNTIWCVSMLGNPVHKVISINNGLIKATVDHAFYVKKADGDVGWAVYDIERGKRSNLVKEDLLKLEMGDRLLNSKKEWIDITNITLSKERIQTYNILSFSGRHNYFANDLLVHEEYPNDLLLSSKLHSFFEKIFLFLQPIFLEFFNKISTVIY